MKENFRFSNGLIWFGAGVSLAEILTGTYFVTAWLWKSNGSDSARSSDRRTYDVCGRNDRSERAQKCHGNCKMSFGEKGSLLFAVLNVLQLVGWTAIMIYDGALAADGVLHTGNWVWAVIIGALIIVWIFIGLTNLGKLNTVAMTALLFYHWYFLK